MVPDSGRYKVLAEIVSCAEQPVSASEVVEIEHEQWVSKPT